MDYVKFGVYAGLLITIATAIGGFGMFVLGVFLAAIGGLVGAHFDGLVDLSAVFESSRRGRS